MIPTSPAVQNEQPIALHALPRADLAAHLPIPPGLAAVVDRAAAVHELDTVQAGTLRANFHDRDPDAFARLLFSLWFHPDETHWIYLGGPYYLELSGAYGFIRSLPPPLPDLAGAVWIWGYDAASGELILIHVQPTRDPIESEICF